jgi:predicted nucleotidyltransferase
MMACFLKAFTLAALKRWSKCSASFTRSDSRQRLTQTLRRYIEDVRKAKIAVAVVVDGSYITAKSEPSDIDLVLALRPDRNLSVELLPMEYNVQSKRMVKRLYGFDVLGAIDGSDVYTKHIAFFSRVRLDDQEQSTSRSRKGLLRIEL